jgi:hypothetical protein
VQFYAAADVAHLLGGVFMIESLCQFQTTQLPDGRFRHVCPGGIVRESDTAGFRRPCDGRCAISSAVHIEAAEVTAEPGTWLKRLVLYLGIEATNSCRCDNHVDEMNAWGPDGCEEHIAKILAWMRIAAAKKKLQFVESQATWLIRLAIDLAKKQRLPTRMERARLRAMRIANRVINGKLAAMADRLPN